MKKRKISITLITDDSKEEYNLLGEYDKENEIITYRENTNLVTRVKLDLKEKILTRENKDYSLKYHLVENKVTENEIEIKELNQKIILKIKTNKFEITENQVTVIYTILDSKEEIKYQIKF